MADLKIGDKVIMNGNYYVPNEYKGKVFIILSKSWMVCGTEVITISDNAKAYAVDGLTKVED